MKIEPEFTSVLFNSGLGATLLYLRAKNQSLLYSMTNLL